MNRERVRAYQRQYARKRRLREREARDNAKLAAPESQGSLIKTCSKCGRSKFLTAFHRANGMRDGHRNECKTCFAVLQRASYQKNRSSRIEATKRWQRENRERHLESQRKRRVQNRERLQRESRERHLKKQYGITADGFELLVMAQFGLCAICLKEVGSELHVDHDHATGRIRGLLCGNCNRAVGQLKDRPSLARSAARYLETHNKRTAASGS